MNRIYIKLIKDRLVWVTNQLGLENEFVVRMWKMFESKQYDTVKWYLDEYQIFNRIPA